MWRRLKNNLGVKLTSLALALLLWAYVMGQNEISRQFRVPLVLPALPDTLMYLIPPPSSVRVTFRSTGRRLFWFRLQGPRMVPSIPMEPMEGPISLNLRQEFLDLPRQFSGSILDINPSVVDLQLTRVEEVEVPVRVVVGREPRHPHRLLDLPQAEPRRVLARGPQDRVRHMPWVRTEPLDLSGEKESGERELALESPDSLIRFTPGVVRVLYEIEALQSGGSPPRP